MTSIEKLISDSNFKHSKTVAQISKILAVQSGFMESEISIIEQAALLHDVGKSSIPPYILNSPNLLTPGEFEIVKAHAEVGYAQIMEAVKTLSISALVAKEHHEKLDGSGYYKIHGNHISPYSRLISVADVFDALISKRTYKESWDVTNVIKYLSSHDNYFDRATVNCLINVIGEILKLYE
jgi:putative nucleotidyltransferase with HDIG domain